MIFLTGGTGFVGSHILAAIRNAGKSVRVLARNPKQPEETKGDVLDLNSIKEGIQGCTEVIHLVGIIRESGKQTFDAMHVQAIANVLEAAKSAGVKRFIHMSALGTRPNARSRYHQTKWKGEELVRKSGIPYVIFRPSIILGAGDSFGTMLAKLIRFSPGIVPGIGNGQNKFQPIAVEDVAACFVKSLDQVNVLAHEYTLAGPDVVTYDQLLDLIMETIKRMRLKLHIPMPLAKLLSKLPGFPASSDQLLMLEEDNTGDNRSMKQDFEIILKPLKQMLNDYLS